jgi:hypothetical protein
MGKARQEWPQGARPAIQGFSADPFPDLRRNISPSMVAAKTALVERSGIGLIVTSISLKLMISHFFSALAITSQEAALCRKEI